MPPALPRAIQNAILACLLAPRLQWNGTEGADEVRLHASCNNHILP
jgi:hypothetical protein